MSCLGLLVEKMTGGQNGDILSGVALCRAHITDATVGITYGRSRGSLASVLRTFLGSVDCVPVARLTVSLANPGSRSAL